MRWLSPAHTPRNVCLAHSRSIVRYCITLSQLFAPMVAHVVAVWASTSPTSLVQHLDELVRDLVDATDGTVLSGLGGASPTAAAINLLNFARSALGGDHAAARVSYVSVWCGVCVCVCVCV